MENRSFWFYSLFCISRLKCDSNLKIFIFSKIIRFQCTLRNWFSIFIDIRFDPCDHTVVLYNENQLEDDTWWRIRLITICILGNYGQSSSARVIVNNYYCPIPLKQLFSLSLSGNPLGAPILRSISSVQNDILPELRKEQKKVINTREKLYIYIQQKKYKQYTWSQLLLLYLLLKGKTNMPRL